MIWSLIRLDAQLLLRSPTALAALALLAGVSVLALASGLDWRARYVAAIEADRAVVAEARAALVAVYDGLDDGTVTPTDVHAPRSEWPEGPYIPDPRDPYVEGFYHKRLAALAPGPLLHLAVGASELAPNRQILYTVPLSGLARPGEPPEAVNPAALAAGRLDMLAVLIFVAPLILIALLFDATARERESGIGPLISALGATRRDLLAARGILRGGAVATLVVLFITVGAIVGAAPLGTSGLFVAGAVLYTAFWTAICLVVASTQVTAVGAAATLAGLWVAVTLLSPSLLERALRPDGLLAPRALADADVRAVARTWGAEERVEARITEVGKRFWNIDTASLPACAQYDGPLVDWSIRWLMDAAYVRSIKNGQAAEARFDTGLDRIGWLSPPLGFRRAMESVAGSDPARNRLFESEVIAYHQGMKERVVAHLLECDPIDREAFNAAPEFVWREPALRSAAVAGGFGSVGFLAAAGFAVALRRSRSRSL